MDVHADLDTPAAQEELFAWVEGLETYPSWLDIVTRAVEGRDDAGPVWDVDLRGRLGPFARTKRLRMIRTMHDPPHQVVFERGESDGRSHSPWVLRATVTATPGGSRLAMHLHYGGGLWGPVMEKLLRDEIARSRPRLLACVARGGPGETR